uniref:Uncharacterized protein n=1 Tax=Arion vulgaris TaxID=1028688 RepID=A0A0B7AK31_9EUPU
MARYLRRNGTSPAKEYCTKFKPRSSCKNPRDSWKKCTNKQNDVIWIHLNIQNAKQQCSHLATRIPPSFQKHKITNK